MNKKLPRLLAILTVTLTLLLFPLSAQASTSNYSSYNCNQVLQSLRSNLGQYLYQNGCYSEDNSNGTCSNSYYGSSSCPSSRNSNDSDDEVSTNSFGRSYSDVYDFIDSCSNGSCPTSNGSCPNSNSSCANSNGSCYASGKLLEFIGRLRYRHQRADLLHTEPPDARCLR